MPDEQSERLVQRGDQVYDQELDAANRAAESQQAPSEAAVDITDADYEEPAERAQRSDSTVAAVGETATMGPIRRVWAEEVPPQDPFDKHLATERRVNIVGGEHHETTTAISQVVTTRVEELIAEGRGGAVLVLNFTPSPRTNLVAGVDRDTYTDAHSSIEDQKGIFKTLNSEQIAEALATAAGGDNERSATAYNSVLDPVTEALERVGRENGRPSGEVPDLVEIRDAIRHLRGMRPVVEESKTGVKLLPDPASPMFGAEVSLSATQRTAVEDSLPSTIRSDIRQICDPLGAWMDKVIRDPQATPEQTAIEPGEAGPTETSLQDVHGSDVPPGQVTVLSVGVSQTAYGRRLTGESALLGQAALPLIAQRTPWGRPEMVVARGLDAASAVAQELIDTCRRQQVPLVATFSNLSERTAPLASGGAYALLHMDPSSAAVMSRILGTKIREDLTGFSLGKSGGANSAGHRGENLGFERDNPLPRNGGTSETADIGVNTGLSFNETYSVSEGPRFRPSDITTVQPGTTAIITPDGESLGTFSLRHRERVGDFPPPAREGVLSGVKQDLARLEEALARAAVAAQQRGITLPGGHSLPDRATEERPALTSKGAAEPTVSPAALTQQPGQRVGQQVRPLGLGGSDMSDAGRANELRMDYHRETGRAAKGSAFEAWAVLRQEWISQREEGFTAMSWRDFRELHQRR